MYLLTWHGTLLCLDDQTGTLSHHALPLGAGHKPLDIEVKQPALRHPALGNLHLQSASDPGAIRLVRDAKFLCADLNNGQAVFDRAAAAAWESFLPITPRQIADLSVVLAYRWIRRHDRRVIRRRDIAVHDHFKLVLGPYRIDLHTELAGLAAKRNDGGLPIALALTHEGGEVDLVVAEPRSSALVQTELWPPRARRVAEILAFAAHRQITGQEPEQDAFERDVTFLQGRQGAAGLEDLLEQLAPLPSHGEAATKPQPSAANFAKDMAAAQAHIEAARTDSAIAAFTQLVAAFPEESELWFRLGELQSESGDYVAAQRAWEKCVALIPGHELATLHLANTVAYFGKPLDSIALLAGLLARHPQAVEPRAFLAQRYAELDWMDEALAAWAPIADQVTDWKEANRRAMSERFNELSTLYDGLAAHTAPLGPLDAIRQARLAFQIGRLDMCSTLMNALPEAAFGRPELHMLESDLRLRRDGLDAAISYLEAIEGPARQHSGVALALARLQVAAGRNDEAAAALAAQVRQSPRGDALRLLCMIAHTARDGQMLRFATQNWSALSPRDTMASQWAVTEAWSDGRLARVQDVVKDPADPPHKYIMQFWDKPEPPVDVTQAMQTWQNRNPGMVHQVFDDAAARAFLSAHCAPVVLECYEAAHHPAMQSDIFRLAFLYVRGGIYVDADDACTRDARGIFAALSEVELIAVRANEAPPYVHNNFIAARPGCSILADALRDAVREVLAITRGGGVPNIWLTTGPGLLTRMVAKFTADASNKGRVLLLSEAEHRSFSITQDLGYKHAAQGDWRLLGTVAAATPKASEPADAAPPPGQADIDDVLMGWALREAAPWQFRPVSHADAHRIFDWQNESVGWIAQFTFCDGQVTVRPKPAHLHVSDLARYRCEKYLEFFRSVAPLLPPGFRTTLCMGLGDDLPSQYDVPMFCFQKRRGWNVVLLPDVDFLSHDFYVGTREQDRLAYEEKLEGAVFAGSTTGALITAEIARDLSTPRLRAAKFFDGSTKVDFRLPNVTQCASPEVEAMLREHAFCSSPGLDYQEQLRRRMLISMDGNGATCSRVAIALHSNSVLLKYESEQQLHYFAGLQPWVHYVPIARDEDVEHVVDMEARDPALFARIAANGRAFAQAYLGAASARRYTAMLLRLYEASFSDTAAPLRPPKKQPKVAPLPPGDTSVMMAHIQSRGDRSAPLGTWLGEQGSALAIEGFAISLAAGFPDGFAYQAVMANGILSDISDQRHILRNARREYAHLWRADHARRRICQQIPGRIRSHVHRRHQRRPAACRRDVQLAHPQTAGSLASHVVGAEGIRVFFF